MDSLVRGVKSMGDGDGMFVYVPAELGVIDEFSVKLADREAETVVLLVEEGDCVPVTESVEDTVFVGLSVVDDDGVLDAVGEGLGTGDGDPIGIYPK